MTFTFDLFRNLSIIKSWVCFIFVFFNTPLNHLEGYVDRR